MGGEESFLGIRLLFDDAIPEKKRKEKDDDEEKEGEHGEKQVTI